MGRTALQQLALYGLLAISGAVLLFSPSSGGAGVSSADAARPHAEPDYGPMPTSEEEEFLRLVGTVDIRSLPVPNEDESSSSTALPIRRLNVTSDDEIGASEGTDAVLTSVAPGAGPLSPPSVVSGFAGLGSSDNAVGSIPPDTQLAVGPTYMVEMVNTTGRVLSKTGAVQQTFSLSSFFGILPGFSDFDPKVIFDSTSSRFFATYVSLCDNATFFCVADTGLLHVAVSTSSDPLTQPWKLYALPLTNDFPDYPGIGLTDDKFTVSYNRFDIDTDSYNGVQVLVAQMSDLVAGVASPATFLSAADLSHFSIRPAHSLSSTSTQYMASVTFPSSSIIHLWQVTGTPAAANTALTQVAHTTIATLTAACPGSACAQQLGTSSLIDSGDNRVLETIWRDGSMWVAATGSCNWAGDTATRSCLKLVEVNTTDNTILQDFMLGALGAYYYYPAIRTDASNNLHVVYTRSSSSEYAHVRIAGRLSTDTPSTMTGDTVVKAGEVAYLPGFSSPPYRWGDYSGASLDPSDPSIVWVAGTYAKNDGAQRWGTWISKLQYGGTPTPTPSPTPTPTPCFDFTPPYAEALSLPVMSLTGGPLAIHVESADATTGDTNTISAVQANPGQSGLVQTFGVFTDTFTVPSAGTYELGSTVDIDATLLATDGIGTSLGSFLLMAAVVDLGTLTPVAVGVLRSEEVTAGGGGGDQILVFNEVDQSFALEADLLPGVDYLWMQFAISRASADSVGSQVTGVALLETHLDQVSICPTGGAPLTALDAQASGSDSAPGTLSPRSDIGRFGDRRQIPPAVEGLLNEWL